MGLSAMKHPRCLSNTLRSDTTVNSTTKFRRRSLYCQNDEQVPEIWASDCPLITGSGHVAGLARIT
ncbi:hypothetical protein BDQ17DRAFT_1357398 [Cyathus striatus]|nr:hypothetical protein BDQ17DRAFT_1357398 [Cyathus striatus]